MRAPISTRAIPPNSERNIANFANCCPGSTSGRLLRHRPPTHRSDLRVLPRAFSGSGLSSKEFPHFTIPAIIPKPLLQIGSPKRAASAPAPRHRCPRRYLQPTSHSVHPLPGIGRTGWKSMCSSCSGRCARSRSKGADGEGIDPRYAGRESGCGPRLQGDGHLLEIQDFS